MQDTERKNMLLITNAYMMNPATGAEGYCNILIKDGRIAEIEAATEAEAGSGKTGEQAGLRTEQAAGTETEQSVEILDASGLVAAPGLVDVHSHFRDPGFTYKEDIASGAEAAARGGYTTVVLMANTKPPVDNEETLDYVLEKGRQTGIHVETCATVTRGMQGKELVPMAQLHKKGAVGFTDDGLPLLDEALVREAMLAVKALDVPISFHEENPKKICNNGINAGKASAYYGIGGSPREAELDLVQRDLELALETGACIDIQHISSREAVELVRRAKRRGGNIHAEATPHHFSLTEEAAITYGTLAKMNPPLREEADRLAIIEGLRDGTIDLIATDHAPHSREEKARPITEAPSGILGLETALALGITNLVETRELTLMSLLEKLTCNPAKLYHLDAGYLAAGGPADLVLFDPKASGTVSSFASKSQNSPFLGWTLTGRVRCTICGGKIIYREGI